MSRKGSDSVAIGAGCLILIGYLALIFGLDCWATQLLLWSLGSFHIIVGFWQAFLVVITAEVIVGLGAGAGTQAAKK